MKPQQGWLQGVLQRDTRQGFFYGGASPEGAVIYDTKAHLLLDTSSK